MIKSNNNAYVSKLYIIICTWLVTAILFELLSLVIWNFAHIIYTYI
jgi:hypothetical protein